MDDCTAVTAAAQRSMSLRLIAVVVGSLPYLRRFFGDDVTAMGGDALRSLTPICTPAWRHRSPRLPRPDERSGGTWPVEPKRMPLAATAGATRSDRGGLGFSTAQVSNTTDNRASAVAVAQLKSPGYAFLTSAKGC
jgi:hypothetical protein